MSRNIEIKARLQDPERVLQLLKNKNSAITEEAIINQSDVFFHVPKGRLKLRQEEKQAQLIYYDREDSKGPSLSDYKIAKCLDGSDLLQVLGKALGIKGIVKKTRHLFVVGQTRVHIDKVPGLGDFIELEVILEESQSESEGKKIAAEFMVELSILEEDLIECAYLDLLNGFKSIPVQKIEPPADC